MINWIKKNKFELVFLLVILSLALFLRIFHIDQVATFLGDQGRDARIVRDLLTKGNALLIGPSSSIRNISLGPLYYYLMTPALLLSNFNPIGPVIMVIILNVLTIFITWFIARKWFGKLAAGITAIFYAISPVAIDYSQCSWNPNPLPLFSLICIWGIYQVWQYKKYFWLPIIGASAAFALQMHHTALLLLPTISIFWFLSLQKIKKQNVDVIKFVKNTTIAILIFLTLMSPLIFYDSKNNWTNLQVFLSIFSAEAETFNLNHLFLNLYSIFSLSLSLLVGNIRNGIIATLVSCLIAVIYLYKNYHQKPFKLISAWLFFTIFGLSLLNYPVLIHYLGTIFPAVFILFGAFFALVIKTNWPIKWLPQVILLLLAINCLRICPTFGTPSRQLQYTEQIANLLINESKGESFNLEVISKNNYDESYLYFLDNKSSYQPASVGITNQLFVICEDEVDCYTIYSSVHLENQWQVDKINIYRLIRTK